jgi:hypothetical protein
VLYFPLYALLFADAGLTAAEISWLLVVWSATTLLLEIPSGAWADAYSRRWLLAGGAVVRAVGFAVWTVWPTYLGFAIGFVLWGIRSATSSGTRQALLYDELAAVGAQRLYVRIVGRSTTVALVSMLLTTALAAPAYAVGGYALVGAASVAACLGSAAVALSLPRAERVRELDGGRYLAHLRAGLREARGDRRVRRTLLLAAAVPGLASVDEYLPLLARDLGAPTVAVPLWFLLPIAAMAGASWFADRWDRASPRAMGAVLGLAGVLTAAGALAGHPVGMVGVAAALGILQFATIVTEARLQDAIVGPSRATVLSVSGFGAEVFAVAVYAGLGAAASASLGPTTLVAMLGAPILIVGLAAIRWLPGPAASVRS